jgi:hypothetical protein
MRIDSAGRMLVGTSADFGGAGQFAIDQDGGGTPILHAIGTQSVGGGSRTIGLIFTGVTNDTGPAYGNLARLGAAKENATQGNTAGYLEFSTTPNGGALTERMRIDSSGNLLKGTTALGNITNGSTDAKAITNAIIESSRAFTVSVSHVRFFNPNGQVGSINTSGSSTSYATSSDYRLKHDIQPMTGALATVAQLKPVTYKWNADDSESQGFIAHELQEVVPECVTGEKDAVEIVEVKDENGEVIGTEERPVYQGIDTSFLVATLTAALQEAVAEINSLKARVEALEGAQA